MKKSITYLEIAKNVLEEADKPLTYKEIWHRAVSMGLDKKREKISKTPAITLASRLYVDVDFKDSLFMIASRKPTTYWLKDRV